MTCRHEGCINPPAPGRNECYKCRSKRIREKDRIRFMWYMIKKSAKKRNLVFELTLDHLRTVCTEAGYVEVNTGPVREWLTIDRIENDKGYIDGNIQVLMRCDNSSKYHHFDKEPKEEYPF